MDTLKQKILDAHNNIVTLETELAAKDAELKKMIDEHKTVEAELRTVYKRRDSLELKVETARKNLAQCLSKLEENQRAADESKKAAANLEKKRDAQEELIANLEDQLQKVTEAAKLAQSKSIEAVNQLREIEEKIDQIEVETEKKEKSVMELHHLNAMYANKLKTSKETTNAETDGIDAIEKKIVEVTRLLDHANLRAKDAEEEALLNQLELAELEDELSEWKDKNTTLRSEIDRINVELQ